MIATTEIATPAPATPPDRRCPGCWADARLRMAEGVEQPLAAIEQLADRVRAEPRSSARAAVRASCAAARWLRIAEGLGPTRQAGAFSASGLWLISARLIVQTSPSWHFSADSPSLIVFQSAPSLQVCIYVPPYQQANVRRYGAIFDAGARTGGFGLFGPGVIDLYERALGAVAD